MNLLNAFDEFDPIHGVIDSSANIHFNYIADKARQYVVPRNKSELDTLLQFINSMPHEGLLRIVKEKTVNEDTDQFHIDELLLLKAYLSHVKKKELDRRGISRAKVYAYYALATVAFAQKDYSSVLEELNLPSASTEIALNQFRQGLASKGREALLLAEEALTTQQKHQRSANIGHEARNKINERVAVFHAENNYSSQEHTAMVFFNKHLSEEEQQLYASKEAAIATFVKAIQKSKKKTTH